MSKIKKRKPCLIPHERQTCELCLFCKEKINLSYTEKQAEKAKLVPQEVKQKILDLIWEGKTVGEAIDGSGLDDHELGFHIIYENIESQKFLRTEAK